MDTYDKKIAYLRIQKLSGNIQKLSTEFEEIKFLMLRRLTEMSADVSMITS